MSQVYHSPFIHITEYDLNAKIKATSLASDVESYKARFTKTENLLFAEMRKSFALEEANRIAKAENVLYQQKINRLERRLKRFSN